MLFNLQYQLVNLHFLSARKETMTLKVTTMSWESRRLLQPHLTSRPRRQ
jgi:hypothetical protein